MHIMIVDDETELLRTLGLILEMEGHRVTALSDGSQALERLRRPAPPLPELLILDLELPGLSGLGVLDGMRSLPDRPKVLVITGHGNKSTVVELMRRGVSDYLDKPFQRDVLLERVRGLDPAAVAVAAPAASLPAPQDAPRTAPGRAGAGVTYAIPADGDGLPWGQAFRRGPAVPAGACRVWAFPRPSRFELLLAQPSGWNWSEAPSAPAPDPGQAPAPAVLESLNREWTAGQGTPKPASAVLLQALPAQGRLMVYNAGHVPVAYWPRGALAPVSLGSAGTMLGIQANLRLRPMALGMGSGDRMLLPSRGFYRQARAAAARHRPHARDWCAWLAGFRGLGLGDMADAIWGACLWKPSGPDEDLFLWCLEIP